MNTYTTDEAYRILDGTFEVDDGSPGEKRIKQVHPDFVFSWIEISK